MMTTAAAELVPVILMVAAGEAVLPQLQQQLTPHCHLQQDALRPSGVQAAGRGVHHQRQPLRHPLLLLLPQSAALLLSRNLLHRGGQGAGRAAQHLQLP